jgi:hypothetical protein
MQGLQHKSVPPQGDDHIGLIQGCIAMTLGQMHKRLFGGRGGAGQKSDALQIHGWIPFGYFGRIGAQTQASSTDGISFTRATNKYQRVHGRATLCRFDPFPMLHLALDIGAMIL